MSIEQVFPSKELAPTEQIVLADALTNSSVRKYLGMIAVEATKELLTLSALKVDKDTIALAHAVVQGKLEVLSLLLSLESSTPIKE